MKAMTYFLISTVFKSFIYLMMFSIFVHYIFLTCVFQNCNQLYSYMGWWLCNSLQSSGWQVCKNHFIFSGTKGAALERSGSLEIAACWHPAPGLWAGLGPESSAIIIFVHKHCLKSIYILQFWLLEFRLSYQLWEQSLGYQTNKYIHSSQAHRYNLKHWEQKDQLK